MKSFSVGLGETGGAPSEMGVGYSLRGFSYTGVGMTFSISDGVGSSNVVEPEEGVVSVEGAGAGSGVEVGMGGFDGLWMGGRSTVRTDCVRG